MVGIADVARLAGVSKSTASRALSETGYASPATRAKVQAAAAALGYVPSSHGVTLATGRTQMIGMLVPHTDRWFFGQCIVAVQEELLHRGLDLALYSAPHGSVERERIVRTSLGRGRFDGLIAVGLENNGEAERIMELGLPYVSIGSHDVGHSAISIDDAGAARLATEHLLGLGHTDIAFIGGRHGGPSVGDARRASGYVASVQDAGVVPRLVESGPTMADAYAAANTLLGARDGRPSAVVALTDEHAVGVLVAAQRLGIDVPGALSIASIDDDDRAAVFGLTTVRQNPREQAVRAVALLDELLIDPQRPAERIWAPMALIVRGSTAAID